MANAQQALIRNGESLGNIRNFLSSFGEGLVKANSTSNTIARGLNVGNREKQKSILKKRELFESRRQAVERREREDVIESGKVGSIVTRATRTISASTKGFLGRIMDFVGTIMIGWILTNLPTIIDVTQKLIQRIQKLYFILQEWTNNLGDYFRDFTSNLGKILERITGFKFDEDEQESNQALKKLRSSVRLLENNFNQMIQYFKDFDLIKEVKKLFGFGTDDDGGGPGGPGGPGGRQTTYTSGNYDAKKLTDLARSVGIPEDKIPTMVAIALAESGGDSSNSTMKSGLYARTGETSYGLWQINMTGSLGPSRLKEFGISSNDDLFDPVINAKAAKSVLNSQGLSAWTVYKTGDYKTYLPQAQQAYDNVKGTQPKPITYIDPAPQINTGTRYRKGQNVSNLLGAPATITSLKGAPRSHGSHGGIDIGCDPGLYISLRVDAEVVGTRSGGGYGNVVDVWIPSLKVQLRFAHNSRIIKSQRGEKIPAGTSFAVTGYSGTTDPPGPAGSHIHLEADSRYNHRGYGGNMSPDPFVALIKLTRVSVQGAPISTAAKTTATPPKANVEPSQTTSTANKVTPQNKPRTIPIPIPQVDPTKPPSRQQGPTGGGPPAPNISTGDELNRFINLILLTELGNV